MPSSLEPRRVGYVLKQYPRLSETFVLNEILGVEASGIDVHVYSLKLCDEGRFHAELARVQAPVRYLPSLGSSSFLHAMRALAGDAIAPGRLQAALRFADKLPEAKRAQLLLHGIHLAGAVVRDGIDHLHAHFMTVAAHTAYLAHLLTGIPFSVTAHAKDIYRDAVDAAVFGEVARAAAAVVTVCDENERFIRERLLGPQQARVVRIYNGLPLADLDLPAATRDPRLVVAVGRLVEKKGFGVLLDACRLLLDRGEDVRCVIVGDGEERAALEQRIDALGLAGHVRLAGAAPRGEVLGLMSRAGVLAAPFVTGADGNRDALPTVVIEALACGLPVVATPVGGTAEICGDGCGLLVAERDATALADGIARLLHDEALWSTLSAAGRERASTRFDRRYTLPQLVDIFNRSRPAGLPEIAASRPRELVS